MKTILFVLLILPIFLFAQKDPLKFSGFEISAGKGPVTSGLYGYLNFENNKSITFLTLSNNDNEITYLRKFGKKKNFLLGPNTGYFFNVPYISYMAIYQPVKYISFLSWSGFFFGDPRFEKMGKANFGLSAQQINFYVWKFQASHTLINYMSGETINTSSLKYIQKITNDFSGYTEAGYDFRNKNQLLRFGVVYRKK